MTPPHMPDAACITADIELFFPPDGGTYAPARLICAGCPERLTCLEYAMAVPSFGMWGGLTQDERRELARAAGRSYHPFSIKDSDYARPPKPESVVDRKRRQAVRERVAS